MIKSSMETKGKVKDEKYKTPLDEKCKSNS